MIKNSSKKGFTLIELSIVIAVIGLLIGGLFSFINAKDDVYKSYKTREQLEEIDKAIVAYFNKYGYLPCAAARDAALETATFGTSVSCSAGSAPSGTTHINSDTLIAGMLPTRQLNLPDSYAFDEWNNRISYVVIRELARNATTYEEYVAPGNDGVITVEDANGNHMTPGPASCAGESCPIVPYMTISHGKSGLGGYDKAGNAKAACSGTNRDGENCDYADEVFVDMEINTGSQAANYYDDVVSWTTTALLRRDAENYKGLIIEQPYFKFKTTSSSAAFNPTDLDPTSGGDITDLEWTCENCVGTVTGTGETPNLDLSNGGNPTEKIIRVSSPDDFTELKDIDFSSKNITSFMYDISGDFSNVEDLLLENNSITSLPASIGDFESLVELDLENNDITTLPYNLCAENNLPNIEEITTSQNEFMYFPSCLGNLTTLTSITTRYTDVDAMPVSIGELTNLEQLDFRGNDLTYAPYDIGNLSSLTLLDVSDNQFNGFEDEIENLTSLVVLHIGGMSNNITSLPESICDGVGNDMTSLGNLPSNLNNDITNFPTCLANLTTLYALWCDVCTSMTTLPANLGTLPSLRIFELQSTGVPAAVIDTFISDVHANRATNFCTNASTNVTLELDGNGTLSTTSRDKIEGCGTETAATGIKTFAGSKCLTILYDSPGACP